MVTKDITDSFREVSSEELEGLEREFFQLGTQQFEPIQDDMINKIRNLMEGTFNEYRHSLSSLSPERINEMYGVIENVYQHMFYYMERKYIALRREGRSVQEAFEESTITMRKLIEKASKGSTHHPLFRNIERYLQKLRERYDNLPFPFEPKEATLPESKPNETSLATYR